MFRPDPNPYNSSADGDATAGNRHCDGYAPAADSDTHRHSNAATLDSDSNTHGDGHSAPVNGDRSPHCHASTANGDANANGNANPVSGADRSTPEW